MSQWIQGTRTQPCVHKSVDGESALKHVNQGERVISLSFHLSLFYILSHVFDEQTTTTRKKGRPKTKVGGSYEPHGGAFECSQWRG